MQAAERTQTRCQQSVIRVRHVISSGDGRCNPESSPELVLAKYKATASCCRRLNQPASAARNNRAEATSITAGVYIIDRRTDSDAARLRYGTLRAIGTGCHTFLTNDRRLPVIPGVRIRQVSTYVA